MQGRGVQKGPARPVKPLPDGPLPAPRALQLTAVDSCLASQPMLFLISRNKETVKTACCVAVRLSLWVGTRRAGAGISECCFLLIASSLCSGIL